ATEPSITRTAGGAAGARIAGAVGAACAAAAAGAASGIAAACMDNGADTGSGRAAALGEYGRAGIEPGETAGIRRRGGAGGAANAEVIADVCAGGEREIADLGVIAARAAVVAGRNPAGLTTADALDGIGGVVPVSRNRPRRAGRQDDLGHGRLPGSASTVRFVEREAGDGFRIAAA